MWSSFPTLGISTLYHNICSLISMIYFLLVLSWIHFAEVGCRSPSLIHLWIDLRPCPKQNILWMHFDRGKYEAIVW